MKTRLEADSIGILEVPADAYYGVQSLRAKHNFPITSRPLHPEFIKSIVILKKAAALTNENAGELSSEVSEAICTACDEILEGKLFDQFIVDAIQGGAGTSANMNANEVIANRADELLGGTKGSYQHVHPNDHVNMAQSTNDIIPSAGKLTVLKLLVPLFRELERLLNALLEKSKQFDHILKMGRTQLQDAVPMRLGQSFHAYASVIQRDIHRLENAQKEMYRLNMGGTAIGTAINVSHSYLQHICPKIAELTGLPFASADNLSKLCNDLRLLSSGPRTGFAEITLPPKQNGSSIMPGKINPVIPEVVSQVAFNIIGNDCTITMAAEAGQLELNAFEPVVFYNLFESIETLTSAVQTLTDNCILGITVNEKHCEELVDASVGISTALCPTIGYKPSAEIAKESLKTGIPVRKLVIEKGLLCPSEADVLLNPFTMTEPQ